MFVCFGGHKDPASVAPFIRTQRVDTVHFVPSMLEAFLHEPAAAECAGLRRVVCSGEALPGAAAQRFFAVLPGAQLHNLYGPTEASVDVTAWQCRPGETAGRCRSGRQFSTPAPMCWMRGWRRCRPG